MNGSFVFDLVRSLGGEQSIVFSNMGSKNQHVRDTFRRKLEKKGVKELGMAVSTRVVEGTGHQLKHLPKDVLIDEGNYTWAVLIDDPDGKKWEELARSIWVKEG